MKKILNLYIFFLLIFPTKIAVCTSQKIAIVSIPKCGSHLLGKCINLLTNKTSYFTYNFIEEKDKFNKLSKSKYFETHLKYTKINKTNLLKHKFKLFFIYRDPRDQIISYAFWIKYRIRNNASFFHKINLNPNNFKEKYSDYLAYKNLSFNEIISKLINSGSSIYDGCGPFRGKLHETNNINEFYQSYLPWKNVKNICSIRFEDLIGPFGNGTKKSQISSIQKIATHLGTKIDVKEAEKISNQLFGGTLTFRQGKIGSWKKYLKKMHKDGFKKIAGNLLIKLKYEKNLNW